MGGGAPGPGTSLTDALKTTFGLLAPGVCANGAPALILKCTAVNSQQPWSPPFMSQELTVDEEEPSDSSFQCLKFHSEVFTLPVFAEEEKKPFVCSRYFRCFSKFQKNLPVFFQTLSRQLGK